jgi:2-polyprenyl-3-methyl-5-hydroxy-6-metoxy-1,4-benzoquinol methylase
VREPLALPETGRQSLRSAPPLATNLCEPGSTDVGCGSGYLLGIFHNLAAPGGTVVGIEHVKELAEMTKANLKKDGKPLDMVTVVTGDGRKGWPEGARELYRFAAINS